MSYQELVQKIVQLQDEGLELFNAGKSVLGKNILATHVGSFDGTQILIQAGIHAREYITTLLLIEQARYLYLNDLVKQGGIYFVFLTNPDGAEIALDGISSVPCDITKEYLKLGNNNNDDFSKFKANINLVDLNTNFDANWGMGAQNLFCPNSENFVGFYPNSEREVQSLINFTRQVKPSLTISYHSKGEVIYYGFEGLSEQDLIRDENIGEVLSNLTGYRLIFTQNSTGGYKDWCIQTLKIPAYTIEVGSDSLEHPLKEETLPEIFEKNKDVPLTALNLAIQYQSSITVQKIFNLNTMEKKYEKSYGNCNTTRFYRLTKR